MKLPPTARIALVLALAGCADAGPAFDLPQKLAQGPRVAGAPAQVAAPGSVAEITPFSAALAAPAVATIDFVGARAARLGARVGSINAQLGVPSVLWAGGESAQRDPAAASLDHVGRYQAIYALSDAALGAIEVERVHDTGRGAIVVNLGQSIGGVKVYGTHMSVVMDRQNRLVSIGGNLHPSARPGAVLPALRMDARAASSAAINDVAGGGAVRVLTERVTPVLYPHPRALELAQLVEIEIAPANSSDSRAYMYVIADDGRILERQNRTFSESFRYRVWADQSAPFRPFDGPQGDWSPQSGPPVDLPTPNVAAQLVDVEAFNTNPSGGSDPWLAAGATVTSGNNVNAYADHSDPDGFGAGDIQANTSSPGVFDYTFDTSISPFATTNQVKAAVVQIFFTINWLHDFYYDSGFNENARVAQKDNFGRGPGGGDALLAEAQDTRGEARNNANMSTLGDGISPRMQMYVWNGTVEFIGETVLTITAPAGIAGDYIAQGASFGVDSEVSATATLALSSPTNGCGSITNNVSGRIVVVDRGTCTFVEKAQNAEAAGASGLIIVNNEGQNSLPPLGGTDDTIAIPVLGISVNSGQTIKNALGQGAVSGSANRAGRVRGADRDGTVDNEIVAHEWGHYFHHRLSFCGGTQQCGAMSEGWGDFMSVQMIVRDGDDLNGVYGVPSFVSGDPFFGIRRVGYSRDIAKNALTFKHIGASATLPTSAPIQAFGANNEVHNAGEVWTTMLTDAYLSLLSDDRLTFAEAERRFSDYLVAGLLASPPNSTITELRDSILAVASANDKDDMLVIAQAFARRGAGTGAVSPDRDSQSMDGVVESYEVAGMLAIQSLSLPADVDCDEDGNWDGGETALVRIDLGNAGPLGLAGTEVEITADNDGVVFTDGNTTTVADLGGFDSAIAEIKVSLERGVANLDAVTFTVTAANADSLAPQVTATLSLRINLDDVAASSATDDVESRVVSWAAATDVDAFTWTRTQPAADLNTVWHADDASTATDQTLESPSFEVTGDLVIEFEHRYSFEQSDGTDWDGGLIEFSTDGGASWQDVGQAVAGYTGVLTAESGNPLGGRPAFAGQSAGYPAMTNATLNLGNRAGQSVKLRFRVGTDGAAGDDGWDIDNIRVGGISNTPFATLGDDSGSCDGILPGTDDDGGGCGCQSSGQGTGGALLFLLALLGIRRRRR